MAENQTAAHRRRRLHREDEGGLSMLWTLVAILVVLWLLGAFVGNLGSIVHLLLLVAVIVVVYNLLTGRRATL
jgi:hypothetical protein